MLMVSSYQKEDGITQGNSKGMDLVLVLVYHLEAGVASLERSLFDCIKLLLGHISKKCF